MGEIEIGCLQKAGAHIEIDLCVAQKYQNKPLTVYLEDQHICTIPAKDNNNDDLFYKYKFIHSEPKTGSKIEIKMEEEILFSSELVAD